MGRELRSRRRELTATLGRAPTLTELAAALAADESDVERALSAELATEPGPELGDHLTDAPSPDALIDDRLLLEASVRSLDERERRIVFLRFHQDMTEREIADEMGISQAHVSRLLAAALATLRSELLRSETGTSIAPAEISAPSARAPQPAADVIDQDFSSPDGASANKIAPVVPTGPSSQLDRYLDLPYSVAVRAEREGEHTWWCATVAELPGCEGRGDTPDIAVMALQSAISARGVAAAGSPAPAPASERAGGRSAPAKPGRRGAAGKAGPAGAAAKAATGGGLPHRGDTSVAEDAGETDTKGSPARSGRFLVRMTSEMHEDLAQAAEREHVSLNRFVTDVLARALAAPDETAVQAPADAASGTGAAEVVDDSPELVDGTPEIAARPFDTRDTAGREEPSAFWVPVPLPVPVEKPDRDEASMASLQFASSRPAVMANLAILAVAIIVAIVLLVLALQQGF